MLLQKTVKKCNLWYATAKNTVLLILIPLFQILTNWIKYAHKNFYGAIILDFNVCLINWRLNLENSEFFASKIEIWSL